MKICPKCQQQFPNGFQYCPNDTEHLITNEEYVRRTRPLTSAPMTEPREQSPSRPPADIVPITNMVPEDIAPSTPAKIIEQPPRETPGVIPPRGTEPFRTGQTEPIRPGSARSEPFRSTQSVPRPDAPPQTPTPARPTTFPSAAGSGGERSPQASQPSTQPWWESQQPLQSSPTRSIAQTAPVAQTLAQTSNFGFAIPEAPSLIARLLAGLRSIGDSFKAAPPMRPGATDDFRFLLKEESLVSRMSREIGGAWNEFQRNPRVFVSEFVRGEGTNRFRRNALLAGSELALTGYFTIYFFLEALGGLSKANPMPTNLLYAGFGGFLLTCFATRSEER